MQRKRCAVCKRQRLVKFFVFRNRETQRRASYCKDCQSSYYKQHYKKNKKRYVQRSIVNTIAQRARTRTLIAELKAVPCADCKKIYNPWQMDFDHLPGYVKSGGIAQLAAIGASRKLKIELSKCEVVCANCHRDRTYKRRNGSTSKALLL